MMVNEPADIMLTVDSIEAPFAQLVDDQTGRIYSVSLANLPESTREGDSISARLAIGGTLNGAIFTAQPASTLSKKDRIKKKMNAIRERSKEKHP